MYVNEEVYKSYARMSSGLQNLKYQNRVINHMARRISFLARKKVRKRVSFTSGGQRISFIAKVPAKRRKRVKFYAGR